MLRLLKPLEYYQEKYGSALYGINMLYLLMEKQHNRGQDGAGVAAIKLDVDPGNRYISRYRSNSNRPIQEIFGKINNYFKDIKASDPEKLKDPAWLKKEVPFVGEVLLGHLRYGTYGRNSIESCHPFLRQNNWMTRNLVIAGNFNLTNVDELFSQLIELGQHPKELADTVTVMEKIGHFLDEENEKLFRRFKNEGHSNRDISNLIGENVDVADILRLSTKKWDGGYVIAGLFGHGDSFVIRDPHGIRPAYWFANDEVVAVASERPALQTAFDLKWDDVQEIPPGHALITRKSGKYSLEEINAPEERKACSFERIYFSRGNDKEIYAERKKLGRQLLPTVLKEINFDIKNTVFSFIPNTAELAFMGLNEALDLYLDGVKKHEILKSGSKVADPGLSEILSWKPRIEKIALKDAKLRTFITSDEERNDMVAHVYDVTYGVVRRGEDTLVMVDDSIVRGTTLKQSILRILDRLGPKKIVIVSSAPQIRFPDCYGIDMAKLGDFIAFQAAIALLKERKMEGLIEEVYQECKAQLDLPKEKVVNSVKKIYKPFTPEEISDKIAELLHPPGIKAEVAIIYQTLEGLHNACPDHSGDWYFSGDYPTPGGNRVAIRAFVNYIEGRDQRAY